MGPSSTRTHARTHKRLYSSALSLRPITEDSGLLVGLLDRAAGLLCRCCSGTRGQDEAVSVPTSRQHCWICPKRWHWLSGTATVVSLRGGHTCSWKSSYHWGCSPYIHCSRGGREICPTIQGRCEKRGKHEKLKTWKLMTHNSKWFWQWNESISCCSHILFMFDRWLNCGSIEEYFIFFSFSCFDKITPASVST